MDVEEQVAWEQDKATRRAAWEEQHKADAERHEREEKRARLEAHLRRREQAWTEHTGTPPTAGMLARWTEEYVKNMVADQELDLELRRAWAANDFLS